MKIVALMTVFDRWRNADRWRRLWNAVPREETLCIVTNKDVPAVRAVATQPIIEIDRPNVGLDLGAFQDAVKGRVPLPEWDWLFVAPDDFLPMDTDFLIHFRNLAMESPNVALVGSRLWCPGGVPPVCRTGGFMIRRDAAKRLAWPSDPMRTKDDCHDFETRSHHMLEQVKNMGFDVRFLPPKLQSIIWDSGHEADQNRLREFPLRDTCDLLHWWGCDKSSHHSYCDVYNDLFAGFRETQLPILELGINYGLSLKAWQDYFLNAHIHGIDINPACMFTDQPRITTHLIDTRDPVKLSRFATTHGPFQLIIDDGSHVLRDNLLAYSVLGSFLSDDGLYVIEDIQDQESLDVFRRMPDATCYDRRNVKGRYDDILISFTKQRRVIA